MRFTTSDFSEYHTEELILWAFFDGKSGVGQMIRDIVQARVEGNNDALDRKKKRYSEIYGIPQEELRDTIVRMVKEKQSFKKIEEFLYQQAKANGHEVPEDELLEDVED